MIVFDLDDTLYLEREFVESGFAAVGAELEALGHAGPDWRAGFLETLDAEGSGQVFNTVLDRFGVTPSPELVRSLVHRYRHHSPAIAPVPGMHGLLDALGQAKVRLAVITDGASTIQRGKLDALGLTDRFEIILPTDELGPDRAFWKPSTRPFEEIEQRAGLPGSALTYIGDNVKKDFIGARARGWRALRLRLDGQLRCDLPTPDGVTELGSVDALAALLLDDPGRNNDPLAAG